MLGYRKNIIGKDEKASEKSKKEKRERTGTEQSAIFP